MTRDQRALWVSTSTATRGGIATYVTTMRGTALWSRWHVHHVVTHRDGSTWRKLWQFARGTAHFVTELLFFRPAVIHLHSSADASFLRKGMLFWLGYVARVPTVIHMHGSDFALYYERSSRPIQSVIRATLHRAASVVALGEDWSRQLTRIAPMARIDVIPNCVRPGLVIRQPLPGESVHVVFLGRIGERKGVFHLLEAWAKLAAEPDFDTANGARAVLTVAGDGDVRRAIELIRALGIEGTVRLSEWLPQEGVQRLLDRAQVLVLPSRSEGQPMAVLEAMSRGICVIASNAGGLGEMIGDGCGLVVAPDDVDAIADALRRTITDDALRRQCGEAGHRRVRERFDADHVAVTVDEMYRRVCR